MIGRLQPVYNRWLRPRIPWEEHATLNGVAVPIHKVTDRTRRVDHDHEGPLCAAIGALVEPGDEVAIIGGGWGVSSTHAAWAGADRVHAYEADRERVEILEKTLRLNGVDDRAAAFHCVVGPLGDGGECDPDPTGADRMTMADIRGDVLVIDAEGVEVDLLGNLAHSPRAIIVEYHGAFDAPERAVRAALPAEYAVDHYGMEVEDMDIGVLGAVRSTDKEGGR